MRFLKKRPVAVVRNDAPALPPKLGRLLHRAGWLLALACTLFMLVALGSYSPDDNSWSHSSDLPQPHNWAGVVGAWLSDILLFVFGLSAWWLPVYGLLLVWFIRRQDERFNPEPLSWPGVAVYGGFTLLLLSSAGFESLRLYSLDVALPLSAGGIVGDMLGQALTQALGFTGASLALMIGVALGFSLFSHVSWLNLMEAIGAGVEYLALGVYRLWRRGAGEEEPTTRPPAAESAPASAPPAAGGARIEPGMAEHTPAPDPEPAPAPAEPVAHEPPVLDTQEAEPTPAEAHASQDAANAASEAPPAPGFAPPRRSGPPRLYLPDPPLPPLSLLTAPPPVADSPDASALHAVARRIESQLAECGVAVTALGGYPGPVVTRYELEPGAGVRPAQVMEQAKPLAQALSSHSLRMLENIPGKSCMGLELANPSRKTVYFSAVLASAAFRQSPSRLTVALGLDASGHVMLADLARLPHVLLAGAAGVGKTTALHAMLLSLLYKAAPEEVRLLLIDPKQQALSAYQDLPHLLAPVVTDLTQAGHALAWCVSEMERRYQLMGRLGVRNLTAYNQKLREADSRDERLADPFSDPDDPQLLELMPAIVVVIDELAELMQGLGKQVEERIVRLAQKARAAGIHLALATQRPTVEVISGLIKANIPCRLALQVANKAESRVILDQMGAENLLGDGDMLYKPPGTDYPLRAHGAWVSQEDVQRVTDFVRRTGKPEYVPGLLDGQPSCGLPPVRKVADPAEVALDPLYTEAVELVRRTDKASVMQLQQAFKIGANRAIRLMEQLELTGVVSAADNSGNRSVLLVEL